jgi:hypothetical protein
MVICSKHGTQLTIDVSRDLQQAIKAGTPLPSFQKFVFNYLGDVAELMLISSTVADRAGVAGAESMELPDQYPTWFMELVPVCEKCIHEAGGPRDLASGWSPRKTAL